MIKYIENNSIFDSKADALINPVNCKGTMGKGIAKEFKYRFPECFPPYKKACDEGLLKPGILLLVSLNVQLDFFNWKRPSIILFPTKYHWREKSKLEWIEQGLYYLKNNYLSWGIRSVGMPKLGCGLGGLEWDEVKRLIEKYFIDDKLEIELYLSTTSLLENI
ncbi:MAG: macro domain-containing protein [Bacteroidales bacterium]|jgi:O-acetyl-ADP-ribose deacetylase (regulator of RNase III)|nr:macro domain-containing protein [Bacteroidales bacterium]